MRLVRTLVERYIVGDLVIFLASCMRGFCSFFEIAWKSAHIQYSASHWLLCAIRLGIQSIPKTVSHLYTLRKTLIFQLSG